MEEFVELWDIGRVVLSLPSRDEHQGTVTGKPLPRVDAGEGVCDHVRCGRRSVCLFLGVPDGGLNMASPRVCGAHGGRWSGLY